MQSLSLIHIFVDFANDNALTVRDEGDRMELPTKGVKEGVSCCALLSLESLLKKLQSNQMCIRDRSIAASRASVRISSPVRTSPARHRGVDS